MLRLVHHLMVSSTTSPGVRAAGSSKRCVILVDSHSDLATAALGLGWDRDQAVGNALRVFRREFDAFWGPRMEDAFQFALMALFEANEALWHVDPIAGQGSQHTVLEVP